MKKNKKTILILGNQGVSVIAILLVLLSVSIFIYQKSDVLFKLAVNKQATNEINISGKIFSNGLFNYTVFSIKERWCMNSKWGKDKECSSTSNMDLAVSNPLNLERLLWSSSAINEINNRYFKLYSKYPKSNVGINKVEQQINISDLDSLGINHPLNIVANETIRRCIDSVNIKIEKQSASTLKPQGDEVYLHISIVGNGKLDLFSKCTQVKKMLNLKGLVVFYPRTLNQFALIKTQNLDVDKLNSTNGKGINFNSPIFVQGDINLTPNANAKVAFRDSVVIGEGILKQKSEAYVPLSYGLPEHLFLNQLTSIEGFFSGVGLDAEVDAGLSKLFQDNYQYPKNTNMAECTNREKLKTDFSLTKDSRLFFSGSKNFYTMKLSHLNEFREYKVLGSDQAGYTIHDITNNQVYGSNGTPKYNNYLPQQYKLDYTNRDKASSPVMELEISFKSNGANLNITRALVGRSTDLKISFADKDFYKQEFDKINTANDQYLDTSSLETTKWGPTSASKDYFKNYDNLKATCSEGVFSDGKFIASNICKRVIKTNAPVADCDKDFLKNADQVTCKNTVTDVNKMSITFFDSEKIIQNSLQELAVSPPTLSISTKGLLSNKESLSMLYSDEKSFSNIFLQHMDAVDINLNAFDFSVEKSPNNTVSGVRKKSVTLPGPNESGLGKENRLILSFDRKGNGTLNKIITQTADGLVFDDKISKSNGSWAVLKTNVKNFEPPSSLDTLMDGPSIEQAIKLDEECVVDIAAAAPPSWDISFTETTQFSWLYNLTSSGVSISDPSMAKPLPQYTFDASNNDMTVGFYSGVPTRSIVDTCTIKSNIDLVFGFYVCQTLKIEPRITPLNIVGTFIVRDLIIDSSASSAGISFYSIWHDEAIKLLKLKKHLRREYLLPANGNTDCNFSNVSGWNPKLSDDLNGDFLSCSPAKFLYQGANNFNWTTVDPELGISTTAAMQAVTQAKIVNRYRRYGMNILWQKEE